MTRQDIEAVTLYKQLGQLWNRIPKQMYYTIRGQIRAGDYEGARKGIQTAQKRRK